ncbi:MAG: helix-turn-helix domain-containing protein [Myxococcales bacterium]|nr:helix-turn-helix domain-containing protein [Myxococcales bacterium]
MSPTISKNTEELEKIITTLRTDREFHMNAIAEIDATFACFGILPDSGSNKKRGSSKGSSVSTRKPAPKKGKKQAGKLPLNPQFVDWWENEERSTADIAKALGISKTAIYNFKNRHQRPGPATRLKISQLSNGKVPADSWLGASPIKASAAFKKQERKRKRKRKRGINDSDDVVQ